MEVKRRTANMLVSRLGSVSEQTRIAALCELRLLSKSDPEIRPMIADEGAVPYLAETLYSASPVAQENAAAALLNVSISSRESVMSTPGVLDALSHVLRNHTSAANAAAVQSSAATLFSLLVDETHRKTIGSKRDILYALIDIVKNSNSPARSIKDALKALFGIALYQPNRTSIVDLGAVPPLFSLVVNDSRVGLTEDATAVIAQVAGCDPAVEAFRRVSGIAVLVDLIDPATGSSGRIRENAISALLNLVKFGEDGVKEEIRGIGGEIRVSDAIEDVVERGSPKGKSKADALLRALDIVIPNNGGGVYRMNLWSRDTSSRVSEPLTSNNSA